MAFDVNGNNVVYVDMTDLKDKLLMMQVALSEDGFDRLMKRTFREVGRRAGKIISKEVRQDYHASAAWIKSALGTPEIGAGSGFPVSCVIPLSGKKGIIGGTFKYGSAKKWISANIVKSGISRIPKNIENSQSNGQPSFKNKANNLTFVRKTESRLPIVPVAGLAVPQMPLTRSKADIEDELLELTGKRLEQNFKYMFK